MSYPAIHFVANCGLHVKIHIYGVNLIIGIQGTWTIWMLWVVSVSKSSLSRLQVKYNSDNQVFIHMAFILVSWAANMVLMWTAWKLHFTKCSNFPKMFKTDFFHHKITLKTTYILRTMYINILHNSEYLDIMICVKWVKIVIFRFILVYFLIKKIF